MNGLSAALGKATNRKVLTARMKTLEELNAVREQYRDVISVRKQHKPDSVTRRHVLVCGGTLPAELDFSKMAFIGELSLSGEVRGIDGALCLCLAATVFVL